MDRSKGPSAPFPTGFVEQVAAFFRQQAEDGVQRLLCYDRDGNVALTIPLPVGDRDEAANRYREAWRIWRAGGSILRIRAEIREGLPQNEDRQVLGEIPDFGLDA